MTEQDITEIIARHYGEALGEALRRSGFTTDGRTLNGDEHLVYTTMKQITNGFKTIIASIADSREVSDIVFNAALRATSQPAPAPPTTGPAAQPAGLGGDSIPAPSGEPGSPPSTTEP
jgi:hypothetical protein